MRACRRIAAAVFLVTLSLLAGPDNAAAAQSFGFHISHYRIEMAIRDDGRVDVTEVLDVDFGSEPHHGIFRTIQVRFDYQPEPKFERVYPISDVDVRATGASAHTEINNEGRYKTFKIGDADKTVTGEHRYTVSYTLHGTLNGFPEHDEFYWNAIGFEWQIPIDQAEIAVTAPGGIQDVRCFTGASGSTQACDAAEVVSSTTSRFAQAELYPGAGVSVAVSLGKGVVPVTALTPILEEKWSLARAFALTPATGLSSVALLAVLSSLIGRMIWRTGRDRRTGAGGNDERIPMFGQDDGPVQYRPPDEARPAQVGVLVDETADPLDVTATIVDLGVRGYLSVEEIEKKGLFQKADWRLTKAKDDDGSLLAYERQLYDALLGGRNEVSLSDLRNTFASDLRTVQDSLYADTVHRGWFARRPDRVRSIYLVVGILATVVSIGVLVLLAAMTHAALIGIPLVLVSLVLLATHRSMPSRTGKGSAALAQAMGFRRYIATAEADRMKFAEEENIFAKYLPYAIVFGETERWAKAFRDIYGDNPPPGMGWYTPYGSWNAFSFGHFAGSMSSFTVQTSGTIVSTPGASGGSAFSGGGGFSGGSSGGGGGGGGGGGW